MSKFFRLFALTSVFIAIFFVNSLWAVEEQHKPGHYSAQSSKKALKKQLEILWPKDGDEVDSSEIEAKIGVADELKDMIGHIHVYLNGKRLDHAGIKDDTLLLWNLKEGENVLELALAKENHDEHSGGTMINEKIKFKLKKK